MKWPFTSICLAFGCLSLASSAPLILDDTAMMYPPYPYLQDNYVNFDLGKYFHKAASSVKNFYSYVNEWIFGKGKDPNSPGYQFWKQHHTNATLHDGPINPNRVHIEAYKVFKDSNGRVVVKNIPNIANLNLPLFAQNSLNKIPMSPDAFNKIENMNIPGLIGPIILDDNFKAIMEHPNKVVKKDNPAGQLNLNSLIMNNPFRWNEKLAGDQMLGKMSGGMMVRPVLVRIEGEMLPGAVGNPLNELLNDKELQNMIAQQIQYQQNPQSQAHQPQPNEPHPEEKVQPQSAETPNAPNQPAITESDKKQSQPNEEAATETPAATETSAAPQEKQDDLDEDDDESDDDQDYATEQKNNDQTKATEPSTQKNEQPKDAGNQVSNANNDAKNNADVPSQQPEGQGKKGFIRVGNHDVSLDTAQKVLEMVQAQNNGNNQNNPFANLNL